LDRVRVKARVHVSHSPWRDLLTVIAGEKPDLLVMEWVSHLDALGLSASEALASPPCNLALVRGPLPDRLGNVLVPLRGGPHAELALRLAIALRPQRLIPLHLAPEGGTFSDAPFRGLEKVLKKLPDVQARFEHTHDPAQTILDEAKGSELVVLGATAQPLTSRTSLGPVSDRLLRECPAAVIAVKTRRAMPLTGSDETVGAQAISILVDKWFAENTFTADEFANLEHLLALKRQQRVTISLALPALNEEETVAKVIRTIKRALVDKVPLLDEICLIDSDSADRTREIASAFGIPVHIHQRLLPELGARAGKGEALWKSLLVTHGDILAWIDTDIVNIHPRFVYGILGPLLLIPGFNLPRASIAGR
jgi:glucosyl-3-phosphoglycerate synthase